MREYNAETIVQLLKDKAKNMAVLYVEDEEALRISTANFLSKLFQRVEIAVDGKDGLDKYSHSKYDIVITDISMPNMNGLELIGNIYNINPYQEIIIMTAHTESKYTNQINTANVAGIIYKPVDIKQMLEILSSTVERLNVK